MVYPFPEEDRGGVYLEIPKGISLVPAVGKWHLGAHIAECFPKYSLNFVDGIGQIDGEILETLWWPIDKVAGITRAKSKAHRQEVLDDNMYDSNWKKWVGIGKSPQSIPLRVTYQINVTVVASLCRKYKKANATVGTMRSAVEELTKSIGNNCWISEWKKLEEIARTKRGEALMIYNVSNPPGMFPTSIDNSFTLNIWGSSITSEETVRSYKGRWEGQGCSMVVGRLEPGS